MEAISCVFLFRYTTWEFSILLHYFQCGCCASFRSSIAVSKVAESKTEKLRCRTPAAQLETERLNHYTTAPLDLDLVWIRLFRPVRAIAEPWDEGDGIEWAKMAVDRVTWQWLFGMPTPALCRGRLPSHWRPPLPGGGSRAATYPVADSHQARVNDGRTEERGTVIQRINRDLTAPLVRPPYLLL